MAGEFIEAARQSFEQALRAHQRRLMREMYRDVDRMMRNLPSWEAEQGWRVIFRGPQARD